MLRHEVVSLRSNPECATVGHIVYRETQAKRTGKIVSVSPSADGRFTNGTVVVAWIDGRTDERGIWELNSHELRVAAHERQLDEERHLLEQARAL